MFLHVVIWGKEMWSFQTSFTSKQAIRFSYILASVENDVSRVEYSLVE